jgi:hypothetical protein
MLMNKLLTVHYQTAVFLQLTIQTSKLFEKLMYLYEGSTPYCKHVISVVISRTTACIMITEDSNDTVTLSMEQGLSANQEIP